MEMGGGSGRKSLSFRIKEFVVSASLVALGVVFELLSRWSEEMKREIADWEEGRVFSLGVLPCGPSIAVKKEGGRLKYLGRGDHDAALKILFKNLDSALLPLTGQMAAHTAFAQHRAIVHGNIQQAMEVNRAMALVTKFLFPRPILKKITKRMPKMTGRDYLTWVKLNLALVPALAAKWFK